MLAVTPQGWSGTCRIRTCASLEGKVDLESTALTARPRFQRPMGPAVYMPRRGANCAAYGQRGHPTILSRLPICGRCWHPVGDLRATARWFPRIWPSLVKAANLRFVSLLRAWVRSPLCAEALVAQLVERSSSKGADRSSSLLEGFVFFCLRLGLPAMSYKEGFVAQLK